MNDIKANGTILIIDDIPNNVELLCESLDDAGYKVLVETNSNNVIDKIKYSMPDLILLDIMMPEVNGFEVCHLLQTEVTTKDIPIIFITAITDTFNKVKGLNLGAVDYITKPFRYAEVLARIQVHLKIKKLQKDIECKNIQLEKLTNNLESLVAERTNELTTTLNTLKQSQIKLIQSEKMSALGVLVAGIGHEINNPLSFILSNIKPAQEYIDDITHIFQLYQKYYPNPVQEIADELKTVEMEFTLEDLSRILKSMQLGSERIQGISVSLRNFSRSDTNIKVLADLHQGLDSTLLILRHRMKTFDKRPEIKVIKNYGTLPQIKCYPGQINQVFMNIIANAIDALEEAWEERAIQQPEIIISTENSNANTISICISDNGLGIPEAIIKRIFAPTFTTKGVGKGTGLGLSISHQIVYDNHQGHLSCVSEVGKGSKFIIQLPVK
ncbi:MAG: hybrid sensor histidine kinase/response regulator [Scytonematopsis contorta HA4267-MV1]|jgi:signal transduction histidine kinase|nr:hybrid sensor histidine kinase/response regulator [Scytonematopsis contorta HA4267-MV1]